jgi:hypothetical protein
VNEIAATRTKSVRDHDEADIENGLYKKIDGVLRVHYYGYWIKAYEPPSDTLAAKRLLIQSLTRRLFNHMEHGINIPGRLLDKVRAAYEAETDTHKRRVKGAMLAGALFNRAADIFTQLVELEACGVHISPQNDLMRSCGRCLQEALEYGKLVRHRNGDAGIDELWGEPFKAFVMSIEDFYESRYVKIAMTMQNIDQVAGYMSSCIKGDPHFEGLEAMICHYADMAKLKCETLRTDEDVLNVWAEFVVAGESIVEFQPPQDVDPSIEAVLDEFDSQHLLKMGVKLIADITRARTCMPKSTEKFLAECRHFKARA